MQSGYLLDTLDMGTTYGVYVQKTRGALDFLKRKGETAHSWPDYNGEEAFTDGDDIRFEPRDIILSCYIKATSKTNFLSNLILLKTVLEGSGLHTLRLPFLTYDLNVYFAAGGALDMLTGWNGSTLVGKFILKLREPKPEVTMPYVPAAEGKIPYVPADEGVVTYKPA